MGIFSKRQENRAEETNGVVSFGDALLESLLGNNEVNREMAMQIPSIAGGIDLIAGIIAATPVKLYKDKGVKAVEIKDDKRIRLINDDTGDTLNANEFWRAMIYDYYLGKGAYAYIHKDKGEIKSLHYVRDEYVAIQPGVDPVFKDYNIMVAGKSYYPHNFLKILRNTRDGMTGSPITRENSRLIVASHQSLILEYNMAKRGGHKRGFLRSDKKLAPEEMKVLKDAFYGLYAEGKDNAIVLNNGVQFTESSSTAAEMQLNENKRANATEFAKIFHVSPDAISGGKTDIAALAKLAAIPLMHVIECALNRDFLFEHEKPEYYWAFDTKELLKGETLERYNAYKTAIESNFLQIDEARYMEDLPELGLNFVKLGLQDVLYDPKTKMIYTPNTNEMRKMDENILQTDEKGAIIEPRAFTEDM